ncbi:hypothetical protein [Streptomyces sp. NPDC001404]|uniref:hypothetical protein n=1 Tax=Streptomyces sp. NPDC001404 TaxID=3364571 RepID=UPI00369D7E70
MARTKRRPLAKVVKTMREHPEYLWAGDCEVLENMALIAEAERDAVAGAVEAAGAVVANLQDEAVTKR